MKKLRVLVLTAALVLGLAGCGGSGTQEALVASQFEALDDLFQRAGAAVAQIDAAAAASGGVVSAGFGEYYARLSAQRDGYAAAVADAKDMEDTELEALLTSLQGAVAQAKPVVNNLEALAPEVEKLGANATALVADLNSIIPLATAADAGGDLQREYTDLAAAYQGLEGQLNETLAQAEGGGLDATLQAVRQANETVTQLCEKASGLLKSLQG